MSSEYLSNFSRKKNSLFFFWALLGTRKKKTKSSENELVSRAPTFPGKKKKKKPLRWGSQPRGNFSREKKKTGFFFRPLLGTRKKKTKSSENEIVSRAPTFPGRKNTIPFVEDLIFKNCHDPIVFVFLEEPLPKQLYFLIDEQYFHDLTGFVSWLMNSMP